MSFRPNLESRWRYGTCFFFRVSGDRFCVAVDQDRFPRQVPPPMAPRFSSRDLHQRRGPLVFHGKTTYTPSPTTECTIVAETQSGSSTLFGRNAFRRVSKTSM